MCSLFALYIYKLGGRRPTAGIFISLARKSTKMCKVCTAILDRLLKKGLVSEGNVKMCAEEIEKEIAVMISTASPAELETIIKHKGRGGYDA